MRISLFITCFNDTLFPNTGKVLVKKLRTLRNDTVGRREHEYLERIRHAEASGDFELFPQGRA